MRNGWGDDSTPKSISRPPAYDPLFLPRLFTTSLSGRSRWGPPGAILKTENSCISHSKICFDIISQAVTIRRALHKKSWRVNGRMLSEYACLLGFWASQCSYALNAGCPYYLHKKLVLHESVDVMVIVLLLLLRLRINEGCYTRVSVQTENSRRRVFATILHGQHTQYAHRIHKIR